MGKARHSVVARKLPREFLEQRERDRGKKNITMNVNATFGLTIPFWPEDVSDSVACTAQPLELVSWQLMQKENPKIHGGESETGQGEA